MIALQTLAAILSGAGVGFSLGLIGGGGSILAVPLLLYVVGISDAHVAIGTSALAVGMSAFINLMGHWRARTVHWPCALVFGSAGAFGAAAGSTLGKIVPGELLMFLFALIMIAAGVAMLRLRAPKTREDVHMTPGIALRLASLGVGAGALSGFIGIGGGFLIVPGIMLGSGMAILNAIGSSLLSVTAFGFTTAVNYALSGFVAWGIAAFFIAGGAIGGFLGRRAAIALSAKKRALNHIFAGVVFTVASYMLFRTGLAIFSA